MLLKNNSKRNYIHSQLDSEYKLLVLTLKPGEVKEVPDNIAKSWLKSGEVVEYVDPKKAKEEQEKIKKENEALKKQIEELQNLKQSNDCAECYADEKTPAQEDCDKCDKKEAKTKASTAKLKKPKKNSTK